MNQRQLHSNPLPRLVSDPTPKIASSVGFRLRINLACDLSGVRAACLSAVEFLAVQNVHSDHLGACELALVEACNNAILYATGESRRLPVEIELVCQAPQLEMHVIDHTPGFEWPSELRLPDP